jgi:hypothetical protein
MEASAGEDGLGMGKDRPNYTNHKGLDLAAMRLSAPRKNNLATNGNIRTGAAEGLPYN